MVLMYLMLQSQRVQLFTFFLNEDENKRQIAQFSGEGISLLNIL